ncbi:MAG TPA: DUF6510 family protein [Gaiellaceae bacterium]
MSRVDGNAMAGMLGEIFVHEMTAARVACGGCGRIEAIGAEHAYMDAPSVVLRCCHCEGVLLVLTRARDNYVLGLGKASWLEVAGSP